MVRVLVALAAIVAVVSAATDYTGYRLVRTHKLGEAAVATLNRVMLQENRFDFFIQPSLGREADILVSPDEFPLLESILSNLGVGRRVLVENYQEKIDASLPTNRDGAMDWEDFHNTEDIYPWVDQLAAEYDFVSSFSIGQTYEGREMMILKFGKPNPDGNPKQNVFIEAGIHAREWISPAVATYLANSMIVNNEDPDINAYLEQFDFHLLPVANPDGYDFSFRRGERLWRKTRKPYGNCFGADPNRNFPVEWGTTGSSPFACSDAYQGPEPFSEVETQNIRDFYRSFEEVPVFSLALHSYGSLLLYPYSYSFDALAANAEEQQRIGTKAMDALNAVNGADFEAIHSAALYPAAGDASDFYYDEGTRLAFLIELRDGNGFTPPPSTIIRDGEEVLVAFKVILEEVLQF